MKALCRVRSAMQMQVTVFLEVGEETMWFDVAKGKDMIFLGPEESSKNTDF